MAMAGDGDGLAMGGRREDGMGEEYRGGWLRCG